MEKIYPWARVVGDKKPEYIYQLDELAEVDALKRLVIFRDCRDVARSAIEMATTQWQNGRLRNSLNSPEKVARLWVSAIDIMERNANRILALRYEDVVAHPDQTVGKLGEWLNVDPKRFRTGFVKETSIGRHRGELSSGDIDRILEIAGPTMQRLNYI